MKQKILFIINPTSGLNKHKGIESLIRKFVNGDLFDFEIKYTQYAGHAILLGKEAVQQSYDLIMVAGGDGTVHEVSQHVIGTQTALGIIPAGSGNGLSMHLQIPQNFEKAIQLIHSGKYLAIDTVLLGHSSSFLGVAGIGFDAHISEAFSHFGRRGFLSYIRLTMKEYKSYRSRDYNLVLDGLSLKKNAFLICFANSSQYGNRAFISPDSDIIDGYINVCILKKIPMMKVAYFIWQLFNKKAHLSEYMEVIKAKEIFVRNHEKMLYHTDGEPRSIMQDLHIQIQPASLKMLVLNF